MGAAISDKEARQNYTIQPFAREVLVAKSSVEICGAKVSHIFCCLNSLLRSFDLSSVYYAFKPP